MKSWKNWLVPALWALGFMASLVPAVVGPVIKGEPLDYRFLAIAFMFFAFAVVFFIIGRKSGCSFGPPRA